MPAPRLVPASLAVVALVAVGCSTQTDSTVTNPVPAGSSSGSPYSATTSSPSPSGADTSTTTSRQPRTSAPSTTAAEIPAALSFAGTTTDGARFDGSSLAGKPVVFWFWAPWCPVCKSQIPQVEALASQYAGEVNVVGVGSLDSGSAIDDFAAGLDGLTILSDENGEVWKHFGVTEQSSFVIFDAAGKEVDRTSYGQSIDLSSAVAGLTS